MLDFIEDDATRVMLFMGLFWVLILFILGMWLIWKKPERKSNETETELEDRFDTRRFWGGVSILFMFVILTLPFLGVISGMAFWVIFFFYLGIWLIWKRPRQKSNESEKELEDRFHSRRRWGYVSIAFACLATLIYAGVVMLDTNRDD
jgi:ABC-type Fe3+ transport system permease subunit